MMGHRGAALALILASCVPWSHAFSVGSAGGLLAVGRSGGRVTSSRTPALRMADGSGKKKIKLGPGLFSPDIQLGPEEAWSKKQDLPLLKVDALSTLFDTHDDDKNGKIDTEEFVALASALGQQWKPETARKALSDINGDNSGGLVSKQDFIDWYLAGKFNAVDASKDLDDVQSTVHNKKMKKEQCQSFFQMVDQNGDNMMDFDEFRLFAQQLGLTWDDNKCDKVFKRLDVLKIGQLTFEEFYAWYSSTADLEFGPTLKEATALNFAMNKGVDDARRVFVRGFPVNAKEDIVQSYFGRAGEIEDIRPISIRNNTSTGRMIITFKDEDSVKYALEMHRFKMGNRSTLEVYRVNRGDKEEIYNVARSMHGALIGIRGSNVQRMQAESGAKIFFESEPKEIMIIKGTAQERAKAWTLASSIIEQNKCDSYKVDADIHGRLIGAGGKLKLAMENESGAHIVYRKQPNGVCLIYGTQESRDRAWQLIQDKMWEIDNDSETQFPLDRKYHGMLTGKKGIAVKALQEEAGVRIRFIGTHKNKQGSVGSEDDSKTESGGDGENANKGMMVVRGTPQKTERAWKIAQVLIRELPHLLSDLREEDIGLGSLISLPLSPAQMWNAAVDSAMKVAVKEVGNAQEVRGVSPSPAKGQASEEVLML